MHLDRMRDDYFGGEERKKPREGKGSRYAGEVDVKSMSFKFMSRSMNTTGRGVCVCVLGGEEGKGEPVGMEPARQRFPLLPCLRLALRYSLAN